MCSVMQRQRQLSPRKVRMVFQFLLLLFFRWRNARRPQGDDELQAAGGPPLLAHRHLQRLRHDRFLHTLCLPPQHGHSHRSLSPGRLLPCVGNVAPFSHWKIFLICRLLGSATLLDESSQAGSQTSPGSVSLIFLLIITLFSGELAGDDQHGDYSFGDHGFSSSPSSFLSSLLLKYLL